MTEFKTFASSLGSSYLYRKPVFLSIIVSLDPPILDAIIGFCIACASTATLPKASGSTDEETTTSDNE